MNARDVTATARTRTAQASFGPAGLDDYIGQDEELFCGATGDYDHWNRQASTRTKTLTSPKMAPRAPLCVVHVGLLLGSARCAVRTEAHLGGVHVRAATHTKSWSARH